jgi:thiamine biosynthesis lipoprotein
MPRLVLSLLAVLATFTAIARADVLLTEEQALKLAFPRVDSVEKKLLALTPDERAAIERKLGIKDAPRVFKYWLGTRGGETDGYAVIDDVLGKEQPITYMVAFDRELTVRSVEILAYRESRGGEIRQADWRAQFAGTTPQSPLRIGSDIRNIAGATISCRSLTEGVRRGVACLSVLVRPHVPPSPPPPGKNASGERADGVAKSVAPIYGDGAASSRALLPSNTVLLHRSQLLMGTTFDVRAYVDATKPDPEALDAAFAEVARLESMLSTWRDDSEVALLNRAAGGEPRSASRDLIELCAKSAEISRLTNGAFDVAVGPLVALWKEASRVDAAPSAEAIERARAASGSALVEIDRERAAIRLARSGAALDFGAIGKGYALDRAAANLEERGIHAALLDFGGQLLALDPPPNAAAWIVEVRDPAQPDRTRTKLRLARASVSSTADYERGMPLGGGRISHVVDPHTGRPVEGMLGTSVVAGNATDADALSTALYVMGSDGAFRFASEHGIAALIVATGDRAVATPPFRALEIQGESAR